MTVESPAQTRRSGLVIVGGVGAIVAEIAIVVSYLLPYATYPAFGSQPSYGNAQFYACIFGTSGTCTYAAVPWVIGAAVIQVGLGVLAAILLLILKSRVTLALAAGALTALGVHEFADWLGYLSTTQYGGTLGIAIAVGLFGALILFASGLVAGVSVIGRQERPAATVS